MKTKISASGVGGLVILTLAFSVTSGVLASQSEWPSITKPITEIGLSDRAISHMETAFLNLPQETKDELAKIPRVKVSNFLESYVEAKVELGESPDLDKADLADFSWLYLVDQTTSKELAWAPVNLEIPGTWRIREVSAEVPSRFVHGGFSPSERGGLAAFATPTFGGEAEFSATMTSGKVIHWTVSNQRKEREVVLLAQTEGCEVEVNSKPNEATVYFNEKKYYKRTNTSSVRNPGSLTIKITKPNYEDWIRSKDLNSGDKWVIEAELKRKQEN